MLKDLRKKMLSNICQNMVKGALTVGVVGASLNPGFAMTNNPIDHPNNTTASQINYLEAPNPIPFIHDLGINLQSDENQLLRQEIENHLYSTPAIGITNAEFIEYGREFNNMMNLAKDNIKAAVDEMLENKIGTSDYEYAKELLKISAFEYINSYLRVKRQHERHNTQGNQNG